MHFEIKLNQSEKMLLDRIINELATTPERENEEEEVSPVSRKTLDIDLSVPEEMDLRAIHRRLNFGK